MRFVLPFGPFTDDEAISEGSLAARAWSEVPCSAFRFTVDRARDVTVKDGDGVSHVVFHTSEWPSFLVPRALAQTVLVVDGNGGLTDADVHVNGADYTYTLDALQARPGTVDLRSILTHELGHVLGLGHSTFAEATMTPAASGTRFRTLERDDEAGVCALYPGKGAPRCPDTPCPVAFVCLAGSCERPGTPKAVCAPCARETDACENAGAEARCIDVEGGRVCARACDADHACGPGFSCARTTEALDLQCVADDGCRTLGVPCTRDETCSPHVCRSGRCVGRGEPTSEPVDAGLADADHEEGPVPEGGCAAVSAPLPTSSKTMTLVMVAVALLALQRRSRRGVCGRANVKSTNGPPRPLAR